MNARNLLMAIGAVALFAAAPAVAQDIEPQKGYKCKSKSLEANWLIIIGGSDKPSYCEATVDKSGSINTSACYEKKTDKIIGDLSGKLSITSRCAISGQVSINPTSGKGTKTEAELYMDAAATSFVGTLTAKDDGFVVVQAIRMK
jgi:hypothetical protein